MILLITVFPDVVIVTVLVFANAMVHALLLIVLLPLQTASMPILPLMRKVVK